MYCVWLGDWFEQYSCGLVAYCQRYRKKPHREQCAEVSRKIQSYGSHRHRAEFVPHKTNKSNQSPSQSNLR